MAQATTTETTEYAIQLPNGRTRLIEVYDNGPKRFARVPGTGGTVELNTVGPIDLVSIERIEESAGIRYVQELASAGAPNDGVPMPKVVARRILTITDPWATPATR